MVRHTGDDCYHAPEIEAIVEPNGVTNDVRRESVALVSTHGPIPAISAC